MWISLGHPEDKKVCEVKYITILNYCVLGGNLEAILIVEYSTDHKEDMLILIKGLLIISESMRGKDVRNELDNYAKALFVKFFQHVSTVYYLFKGTIIHELQAKYFDFTSINILTRAALETYIIFHYIFIDPKDEEEKLFRYHCWRISSEFQLRRLVAITTVAKDIIPQQDKEIEELKTKIKSNKYFNSLTNKQKRRLIENGDWQKPGWKELASMSGLSDVLSKHYYSYLCGHVHVQHHQVRQVYKAMNHNEQQKMTHSALTTLMLAMALMGFSYMRLFSIDQKIFAKTQYLLDKLTFYKDVAYMQMNKL